MRALITGAIEYKIDPTYITFLQNQPITPLPKLVITEHQQSQIQQKVPTPT